MITQKAPFGSPLESCGPKVSRIIFRFRAWRCEGPFTLNFLTVTIETEHFKFFSWSQIKFN